MSKAWVEVAWRGGTGGVQGLLAVRVGMRMSILGVPSVPGLLYNVR